MNKQSTYEDLEKEIKDLNAKLLHYKGESNVYENSSDHDHTEILTALLSHTSDCILICDEKGTPQTFNKAYAGIMKEAFGIDMKPGIKPHERLNDTDAVKYWDQLRSRALGGDRFRAEYTHKFAKNDIRTFETSFTPIERDNKIKGFIEVTRDITGRKRLAFEQEQAASQLEATLEATVDGIIVVGLDEKIKVFSKRFKKIWDMPDSVLHSKDANQALAHVLNLLNEPKVFLQKVQAAFTEIDTNTFDTLFLKDGRVFEVYSRPQKINDNTIGRVWGFRDVSHHYRAEIALKKSEKKYKSIIEDIEDGYYEVDLVGNFTFFNESMRKILDYPKEELTGLNNRRYMDEENAKKVFKAFNMVYKTGKPYKAFDWKLIRKDGSKCYVETTVSLKRDSKGQSIGFHGIARDITERKQAETAIIKERNYISKVLYWIDSLVVVIDIEGYIISFNRASEQLSGYSFEELKGKPFWDTLLAPDEREGVKSTIKDVIHKEFTKDFRNHWITKTGEKRLIQWHNSVLRKGDGSIEYILCTGLDITERQRAETALRESESKYRELVQNANSIIARFDTKGNITFLNEYAEKFFGYEAEEIIGKNIFGTILPETDSSGRDHASLVVNITKHPEQYASNENENMLRNGQRVWVAWTNKAIYDQMGDIKEILCIGNDITERKVLEKQLRQSQKMEALGTLSGGIAHEFNNILGIILGNTELAIDDVPEWNPAKDCLKEIRTASLRAKDVVRQIMSFSRKTPATRKPIQISTIIQESLKLMRATIPANIDIRQEILCKDEMILANPTEINQILLNLCSNSVHALEGETGMLKIRLERAVLDHHSVASYEGLRAGECVKLTIKDSGHGIDPKIKGLIFDPYFTTKDVDKGLGMGLAVVYGIVKKHEGAISVSSKAGKGTTVEVLFPVTNETAQIDKEISKDLPRGTERILFVDDEASLVKMVTQMLNRQGYGVVGKTSSNEALQLFQEESEKFDLVITDMAMPGMTGDRLAQELIKIRPNIPVIICTGHSDSMDEGKAKKSGIAAYAMKPLEKTDLVDAVRKVLDAAKGSIR